MKTVPKAKAQKRALLGARMLRLLPHEGKSLAQAAALLRGER